MKEKRKKKQKRVKKADLEGNSEENMGREEGRGFLTAFSKAIAPVNNCSWLLEAPGRLNSVLAAFQTWPLILVEISNLQMKTKNNL